MKGKLSILKHGGSTPFPLFDTLRFVWTGRDGTECGVEHSIHDQHEPTEMAYLLRRFADAIERKDREVSGRFNRHETHRCPHCGDDCYRESADVGVGIIYGPWGCPSCRWSEDERYDLRDGDKFTERGGKIDQFGGIIPKGGYGNE